MKKQLFLALLFTMTLSIGGCGAKAENSSNAASEEMPVDESITKTEEEAIGGYFIGDFDTVDLNQNKVTNDIFKDKTVTFVNVWGTFCPPCIDEMPDLQKLSDYAEENGGQVVGIVADATINENIEEAITVTEQTGVSYLNIVTDEILGDRVVYQLSGVPTSFLVDSNGNIVSEVIVGARSLEDYQAYFDEALAAQQKVEGAAAK